MQRPKIYMMFFYDFPSTNYQRPHKKFNFPPPALAPPPPPPLSDINNANSNAFEQLHKYQ